MGAKKVVEHFKEHCTPHFKNGYSEERNMISFIYFVKKNLSEDPCIQMFSFFEKNRVFFFFLWKDLLKYRPYHTQGPVV